MVQKSSKRVWCEAFCATFDFLQVYRFHVLLNMFSFKPPDFWAIYMYSSERGDSVGIFSTTTKADD